MSRAEGASANRKIRGKRPAEVVIGLDVGTTDVKAVAFGVGHDWRTLSMRQCPPLQGSGNQEVQDPAAIQKAVRGALAECASAVEGAEVLAISVGSAMHGLIGLDSDVQPLTPLITWADSRAREQARRLRNIDLDLHALTGVPVHPMSPLVKLVWFADHEPHTLTAVRWWAGLKELVLSWLTDEVVTELSSASGTGLLDINTRKWSSEAIRIAGISPDQLPAIVRSSAQLSLSARAASLTGLPAGTIVIAGGGDGPLANVGTGAIEPGTAGMSLGTSGAVRMATRTAAVDSAGSLFCYSLTEAIWVLGSAISNGGAVARWAERALTPDLGAAKVSARRHETTTGAFEPDERLLELAASVPPGSEGLLMLPYLLAERGPLWDPNLPGAYLGLRIDHTRAHLVRAAIEGVCAQMRLIVDRLSEVHPVRTVRATGGVFRSQLWREVMAAMIDRPLEVVSEAEGTALGAAALGLFALRRATTLGEALAQLVDPPGAEPLPVPVNPALVAVYDSSRAAITRQIAELGPVGEAFADSGHGHRAARQ
jgi:gluconokinase